MTSMQPLWQIEEELATLVDSVDVCPPELRVELEGRIADYIGHEAEKVDRINGVLTSFEQVANNAQAEIERLRQRQQAAQRAAERLSDYMLRLLQQREGKPLKGRNVTFSIRKSEAVVIVDPQQVPEQFRRTTVSYDFPKDALKKAIKEGQEVAGVVLEQREHLARK